MMLCPLLGWDEDEDPYSYDCTGCNYYDRGVCRMKDDDFIDRTF